MELFLPTVILRHRRENLKKCSLRGLEERADMRFYTYPTSTLPDLSSYVLLGMDAPTLSKDDAGKGMPHGAMRKLCLDKLKNLILLSFAVFHQTFKRPIREDKRTVPTQAKVLPPLKLFISPTFLQEKTPLVF